MIRIRKASGAHHPEPLISAFGFKGGSLTELWQTVVRLEADSGEFGIGLGVQSVLWSDAKVFETSGEAAGNQKMFDITKHAVQSAEGAVFSDPFDLLDQIVPKAAQFGQERSGLAELKQTFVLNALTAFDHAAWSLFARTKGTTVFKQLLPEAYQHALSHQNERLATVPLIPYGMSEQEMAALIDEGYAVLKLKIGADPDGDNDPQKMLEWDKQRLHSLHRIAKDAVSDYTTNGKIAYYLDANGRYDNKERVMRLLDYADQIGALEHIVILEEPFPEEVKIDVSDLPVTVAADESVHQVADAEERIALGYKAFALKPVAKTMTVSLNIAKLAYEQGAACFCADLTASPLMVDWNKCLAAHLAPIPGLKIGMIESNGAQNYRNWPMMEEAHPCGKASWTRVNKGAYELDDAFYAKSGGAFALSEHYF